VTEKLTLCNIKKETKTNRRKEKEKLKNVCPVPYNVV